ncbi:MAG: NUDIX domain-containing protein [Patescibacteria group bacterium]
MDTRKPKIVCTLVLPIYNMSILMGKKTDTIGIDQWNGWGGEVEEGETVREAAVREFKEESNLSAQKEDLKYFGTATFHNKKKSGVWFVVIVHIFLCYKWRGKLKVGKGMKNPTFIPINRIPFDNMMPADEFWLPRVLAGRKIYDEYWYSQGQQKVERKKIGTMDADSDVD